MRGWLGVALLTLLMMISGNAAAHLGGVQVTVEDQGPAANFEQAACLPKCPVDASEFGYVAPVTVVPSGASVGWQSLNTEYHTATEAENPNQLSQPRGSPCFNVPVWPSGPTYATFEIREDGLWAMVEGEDAFSFCNQAVALPDGSYAVHYLCQFHQTLQHGILTVTPTEV